jgi:hypothetical protein
MHHIRHQVEINTSEDAGYLGLIGAVIHQAVKDYQDSYKTFANHQCIENYHEFKRNSIFFEHKCNGYIDEYLSDYIYEKAKTDVEKEIPKEKLDKIKKFIKDNNLL